MDNVAKNFFLGLLTASVLAASADEQPYDVSTNEVGEVTVSNLSAGSVTIGFPFLSPDVTSVLFTNNFNRVFRLESKSPSTYAGGTVVHETQVRVYGPGVFGSGDVTLVGGSSLVAPDKTENGLDVGMATVTNTVRCFDGNAWMLSMSPTILELTALGGCPKYPYANIGRQRPNPAIVQLSLAGEHNEPLAGIKVRGTLDLRLNGPELKAAACDRPTYFIPTDTSERKVSVTSKGFSFDAAADVDVDLGLALTNSLHGAVQTNVISSVAVNNGSFESGVTGWQSYKLDNKGSLPGVFSNGSTTWVGSPSDPVNTPYGTKYHTIRGGQALVSTVATALEVDEAWYLSFAYARRNGYFSGTIGTSVTISNATTGATQTLTVPALGEFLSFKDVLVGPFNLPSGNYHVCLETSWDKVNDANGYGALSFDNFSSARSAPPRPASRSSRKVKVG